ncbi:voltage-gated chloride channel protein [Acetobacteraceae bacterium]|nr:voltage-gated chloride channel protein [Acetobacteraceae bacterium]
MLLDKIPTTHQSHAKILRHDFATIKTKIFQGFFWFFLLTPLAVTIGILTAFFFLTLEKITYFRFDHSWIIFALPLAGVAMALTYIGVDRLLAYQLFDSEKHHLDLEEKPTSLYGKICRAIAPFIRIPIAFLAALGSNLFGASVGREGVALHMAGNLSLGLGHIFRLEEKHRHILTISGIAGGFGAIFGAPVAGAIFVLEATGLWTRLGYGTLLACAYSSIIASLTCHVTESLISLKSLGDEIGPLPLFVDKGWHFNTTNPMLLLSVALAAIAFGIAGYVYTHGIILGRQLVHKICKPHWLHPAIGGVITILLFLLCGTDVYLGLGTVSHYPNDASTVNFFTDNYYGMAWLWKLVFTLAALSTGFRGGKVTPMFFIGAALGSSLAPFLGAPPPLLAGAGMLAMFAAATSTPFTCMIMGAEIFGTENFVYCALACIIAYAIAGEINTTPPEEKLKELLGVKQQY